MDYGLGRHPTAPGGRPHPRTPVCVDTATLALGEHRLVVRADSDQPTGRLAGVQVVPFTVR
jgi:hypothetical protein